MQWTVPLTEPDIGQEEIDAVANVLRSSGGPFSPLPPRRPGGVVTMLARTLTPAAWAEATAASRSPWLCVAQRTCCLTQPKPDPLIRPRMRACGWPYRWACQPSRSGPPPRPAAAAFA